MASRSSSKRPRLEFVSSRSRRHRPRRGRGGSSGLLIAQPRRRDPAPVLAVLALLLLVAAGVAAWVLLHDDGKPGPRRPSAASYHSPLGASVVGFDLDSRLLRRTMHPVGVAPAGDKPAGGRPLLVLLHANGMPPDFFLTDGLFRALRAAGPRAPAVVAVDGGTAPSFWHDRRSGAWASMVLREAIPSAARELGADPRRVAIGGVAMGGFGALDLGRRSP